MWREVHTHMFSSVYERQAGFLASCLFSHHDGVFSHHYGVLIVQPADQATVP